MSLLRIEREVCARIPTPEAEFQLFYYRNNQDGKEHLALVTGDVSAKRDVLVRVHSECFTGDVIGSLRCDCGGQLYMAMQRIANEGRGVVLYLRQEGRGIGLPDKLRAYNLQDRGHDTVDANLLLGHEADERDYEIASLILQDIGVQSVRLLTNNPSKIEGLQSFGIEVTAREPLQSNVTIENKSYLATKANRMGHLLELGTEASIGPVSLNGAAGLPQRALEHRERTGNPFVTLTYAQSLDGSIARIPGKPMGMSGPESRAMTHGLRSVHDAILVGIGTVIADNPRLTVRLAQGPNPQPVILDSRLRFPSDANLLNGRSRAPWIVTTEQASRERTKELEELGARIICLPATSDGRVDLPALLGYLARESINSVMVEGGARVVTSFLSEHLIDHLVLTIAPIMVGGIRAVGDLDTKAVKFPRLVNLTYQRLGDDLVVSGDPDWSED